MLSVESVDKQNQEYTVNPNCRYLDDFMEMYTNDGYPKGIVLLFSNRNRRIAQPHEYWEAEAIVSIYKKIYGNSYPYKEMLNPDYIYQTFSNPKWYWGIYKEFVNRNSQAIIIGCFAFQLNFLRRSAYMRGLNILPLYQKKVNCKQFAYGLIHRFFEKYHEWIDKWYCEARTAHKIVQYMTVNIGGFPYAVLEGKDYFFHKKESSVLMVNYFKRALFLNRSSPKKIHPSVVPFFSYISHYHHFLKETEVVQPSIQVIRENVKEILQLVNEMDQTYIRNNYGTYQLNYFHKPSKSSCSATYTSDAKNIEDIRVHCDNLLIIMAFLVNLHYFAIRSGIEYIEWKVPVEKINMIELLRLNGYKVVGYIPAWIPDGKSSLFHDAVVCSWSTSTHTKYVTKLIQQATYLTNKK